MQKNEIRIFSNTIYKNLKWIKDLNVRPGTTKLLEESIGQILFNINHSNIFLVPSPTVKETKAKIDKWNLIKCKNFCTAKEAINKTKNNLWNSRKYKWCDQQGINLQTIQAAFKFEEIPNSRAWAANCSVSDFKMLLTVIHSKTFFFFTVKLFCIVISCLCKRLSLSHTHTHTYRDTHEKQQFYETNVILAPCSNIFYYICSILVHTKDKTMVTSPQLISWFTDCTCSFQTWLLIVIPLDWASGPC